jgi:hypothetical protein
MGISKHELDKEIFDGRLKEAIESTQEFLLKRAPKKEVPQTLPLELKALFVKVRAGKFKTFNEFLAALDRIEKNL